MNRRSESPIMFSILGIVLATASLSSAHFILHWPPTAGFIDDSQGTGPCGGATVSINGRSPQIQVNQFAVQIESTHPEGQWTFRGTLSTEEPYDWTDLVPTVSTTGLGDFCLTSLSAPIEWENKPGVLQVIDTSTDGMLYQVSEQNACSQMHELITYPVRPCQFRYRLEQHLRWRMHKHNRLCGNLGHD